MWIIYISELHRGRFFIWHDGTGVSKRGRHVRGWGLWVEERSDLGIVRGEWIGAYLYVGGVL